MMTSSEGLIPVGAKVGLVVWGKPEVGVVTRHVTIGPDQREGYVIRHGGPLPAIRARADVKVVTDL